MLDGDSNGDATGSDYSYIIHHPDGRIDFVQDSPSGTNHIRFYTEATERLRLTNTEAVFNEASLDIDFRVESNANAYAIWVNANDENIGFGNTINIAANGHYMHIDANNAHLVLANTQTSDANPLLFMNRQGSDGEFVAFRQANALEGRISVSGSTVTYHGFSGLHESSGIATNTELGTVVSTIDELDTYPSTQSDTLGNDETNPKAGQTRADHPKVKISDTVGDACVYGVVAELSLIHI